MKGAIASGHAITTAAAEEILQEGGNAFDAVIAAHFAACVAEPVLASLGGGGYCLTHSANGDACIYDFFGQTPIRPKPASELDFYPIEADFGTTTQEFHIGLGSVAVPGAVKGMFALHRDYATLPMHRLVEPAVRAANQGITLHPLQAYIFDIIKPIYLATPAAKAIFGSRNDPSALCQAGETLIQADMADTLEALGREGEALFYLGDIAQKMAQQQLEGGALAEADFRQYCVIKRQPLRTHYRGATFFTNPPPSSGGLLISFALQLLADLPLNRNFGSIGHLQALAEVMAATQQARLEAIQHQDPLHTLSDDCIARYKQQVAGRPQCQRGTTQISVIDNSGNAASMTVSNGEGCGHIVPGTGIMLNNILGEEDLNPLGFHHYPANTRMTSMMAPSLLQLPDDNWLAFGSGGSNRLRTAILQVLINIVDFNMSPAEAVSAPRIHVEKGEINIEPGFDSEVVKQLNLSNFDNRLWPERNLYFGGVHTVQKSAGRFAAEGDLRRAGAGLVVS